jgi:hypothetical protein
MTLLSPSRNEKRCWKKLTESKGYQMHLEGADYKVPDKRFKPPGMKKTWQVTKIWELHDEIKRRILLGQKNTVIAEALACSPQTVSNVRNSDVIQDQLAIMRGARDAATVDIARDIQEFAPKALELLKDVVNGDKAGANASISLRAKEANNFLDRAGHSAVKKHDVRGMTALLTIDDIERIKKRALEAQSPIIADAEAEVINETKQSEE